jgi:hypothetical protein
VARFSVGSEVASKGCAWRVLIRIEGARTRRLLRHVLRQTLKQQRLFGE